MAEFSKAWLISSGWEGPWVKVPEKDSKGNIIEEELFKGVWWGTNHGLTGKFMKEFTRWKAHQKEDFKKMTASQCGVVWKDTRWTWLKGDKIENQEIANLCFDWGVRRWNSLINGVRTSLGQGLAFYESDVKNSKGVVIHKAGDSMIGEVGDAYNIRVTNISVGGDPSTPTAGFFIFTDLAIEELNQRAKLPNGAFHTLLKDLRKKKDNVKTGSILDRYNSFYPQGTPTKSQWEKMRDKGVPPNQRTNPVSIGASDVENTEGGGMRLLAYGAGIFISGKFLKWW